MDLWALGGIGAATALIASSWNTIKGMIQYVLSAVRIQVTFSGQAGDVMMWYVISEMNGQALGLKNILGTRAYIPKEARVRILLVENIRSSTVVARYGVAPILLTATSDKKDRWSSEVTTVTLTGVRGLLNAEKLIGEAVAAYTKRMHESDACARREIKHHVGTAGSSISIGRSPSDEEKEGWLSPHEVALEGKPIGWCPEKLSELALAPVSTAVVSDKKVAEFFNIAKDWATSKDWYHDKGLVWRLSALFYGPPGTGKTLLTRVLSYDLALPLHIVHLSTMRPSEFNEVWAEIRQTTPCIVLFDDIDMIFNGRDSEPNVEITFDMFLDALDGASKAEGVLTIMTTNNPEKLDAALANVKEVGIPSRPGRVDYILAFGAIDDAGKQQILNRILADQPEIWESILLESTSDTGAQFEFRCARAALHKKLKGNTHGGNSMGGVGIGAGDVDPAT